MKFTGLITLALATATLATPTKRQTSPTEIISGISSQLSDLGSAVDAFNGGDPAPVQSASDSLVSTINDGADTVNAGPDLTSTDALALTGPIQDLTTQIDGVITNIIDKQDQFVSAGAGGQVRDAINQQLDAANALAEAITSKVPESLSSIAEQLASGISAAIQRGVDAYANVEEGGGSSSTGSATGTATATETGSATETATETSTPTSSTPVIPTGSETPSSSASPTSGPTGTPTPPEFTGAASSNRVSFVGGALAAVAVAVAI